MMLQHTVNWFLRFSFLLGGQDACFMSSMSRLQRRLNKVVLRDAFDEDLTRLGRTDGSRWYRSCSVQKMSLPFILVGLKKSRKF